MGRRKVRNYPSLEEYERYIKNWLEAHQEECENLLLRKFGYENIKQFKEGEYRGEFGFVCGNVRLYPRNSEMVREWRLDNGVYGAYIHDAGFYGYNTQLIVLKKPIVEYMLKALDLEDVFCISELLV